jgi:hypothetical protein
MPSSESTENDDDLDYLKTDPNYKLNLDCPMSSIDDFSS